MKHPLNAVTLIRSQAWLKWRHDTSMERNHDRFGCFSSSRSQRGNFPSLCSRASCTVKVLKADKALEELSASRLSLLHWARAHLPLDIAGCSAIHALLFAFYNPLGKLLGRRQSGGLIYVRGMPAVPSVRWQLLFLSFATTRRRIPCVSISSTRSVCLSWPPSSLCTVE